MIMLFFIGLVEALALVFLVVAHRRLRRMQLETVALYADAVQKNKDAVYAVTVATTPDVLETIGRSTFVHSDGTRQPTASRSMFALR